MNERIWQYYKDLAEKIGIGEDGIPYGYSVSWFYEEKALGVLADNLNTLTKAFLQDDEAKAAIKRASKSELEAMNAKVMALCDGMPIPPYPAQVDAISNALLNDITIIQGPPGTGKTETIKNILLCIRDFYPDAKIAVISANSEAIENAKDAVSTEASLAKCYARLGPQDKRKEFKKSLKEVNPDLHKKLRSCKADNKYIFPKLLLDSYPIIFSTIHSLRKCVADMDEYDYVIVDECSQVPCYIGLIAMSSAKHLILLGDNEQLPPIHKKIEGGIDSEKQLKGSNEFFIDKEDNSFMKACGQSFGDRCSAILLNEHFRCHPAIIGFCNEKVYKNQLIVKTSDAGKKLPIRIRWYEGDYWECIDAPAKDEEDKPKNNNYNKRQIEIFVREELPDIYNKLIDEPDYSICVLSPFKYQLELLQERIQEVVAAGELEGVIIDNDIEYDSQGKNPEDEEAGFINKIPQLTIHKAQGRGYDRVYIMPVQDAGNKPWSQKKTLINVAISRAKKEICVITSAVWLPEEMQEKELGYLVKNKWKQECYLRDFLGYVYAQEKLRDTGADYGFIRTSISSVFDKIPYYRQKFRAGEDEKRHSGKRNFAPEECLYEELKKCDGLLADFEIHREVELRKFKNIPLDDEEIKEYVENGARFDFVIAKAGYVYAIIEVDGAYHRSDEEQAKKDELKDRIVSLMNKKFAERRYLRLSTDGTSSDELDQIIEAVFDEKAPVLGVNEIMNMEYLDNKLLEAKDFLEEHLNREAFENRIQRVNFGEGIPDYSDEFQVAFYMMKYAKYYALEYYWIYDLVLRLLSKELKDAKDDVAVVYTFGCGSMVDALSLLYAHRQLLDTEDYSLEKKLYYRGIDIDKWADVGMLFPEEVTEHNEYLKTTGHLDSGMVDFWSEMQTFLANVIMFPKMLSEVLDDDLTGTSIIDQFCERVSEATLVRDYIIICVSYRGSKTFDEDNALVEKIIATMREKGYAPEAFGQDVIDGWVCNEYFDLIDDDKMVFQSKDDCIVDYENKYADFNLPVEVQNYMSKGGILVNNCDGNITDDQLLEGKSITTICEKCVQKKCRKIRSIPRKNLNMATGENVDHTVFQILPFRRE